MSYNAIKISTLDLDITDLGMEAGSINSIYLQSAKTAGGIVHAMNGGLIDNCYNAGSVSSVVIDTTGRGYAGGIAGYVRAAGENRRVR